MCQVTKCHACFVLNLSLYFMHKVFIIAKVELVRFNEQSLMKSTTCLLLFATAVGICIGLSCPPKCKRKWCVRYVESKLQCAGNLVKDACGCCYVCAKQLNESCGGIWNAHGSCDVGLRCNYSYEILPDHPPTQPGICKKKRELVVIIVS